MSADETTAERNTGAASGGVVGGAASGGAHIDSALADDRPVRAALADGALDGRTVIVTGASDGIGRAAVRGLVLRGARVVMVGRNEAKTAAAANSIMSASGRRSVAWEIADLSRQDAVREVADRIRERHARIDVLVNNAGAFYLHYGTTADGLERTFALNHLAYFTLSLLLLDRLAESSEPGAPARIINVASRAHRNARLDVRDLQMTRGYRGWRAYANSKLCNILFTRALARRVDPARVVVHAMHPGLVSTRFATNNGRAGRLLRRVMDVASVDATKGADTLVWLTECDDAAQSTGDYWVRRTRRNPSRAARNPATEEALWQESARLSGLDVDVLTSRASRDTGRA